MLMFINVLLLIFIILVLLYNKQNQKKWQIIMV